LTLYELDTNIVSDMISDPAGQVARSIGETGENNICLGIITAAKLRYEAAESGSPTAGDISRHFSYLLVSSGDDGAAMTGWPDSGK
jgi:predicted nucleic acid-binding protein